MKRATVLAIALLLSSCVTLRSWFGGSSVPPVPPRPDASLPWWSDTAPTAQAPIWIEGSLLRAANVAVSDFSARNGSPRGDPLSACLARLESWDVQLVAEEADRWVLFVRPQLSRCADAGTADLVDAAAEYVISKHDFSILAADLGGG